MNKVFTFVEALESLCQGAEWTIYGNDPDRIIWHTEPPCRPTREELEAEVDRLQSEYDAKLYARQRAPEYPSIGDQLDALFHAGVFPPEMAAKIQAVKDKFPKS